MRKITVYIGIAFYLSFLSNSTQAQVLKKKMDTIKSTAKNRGNEDTVKSANKAISKTLNNTKSNTNLSSNEGDTSSVDVTGKTLGIFTGSEGSSTADSATAIQSFMNGTSDNGFYYEITNTVVTERDTAKSINKVWFTTTGEGRFELNSATMMGVPAGLPLIAISHTDRPKYSIILDDEKKTYSLNIIDSSVINSRSEKYSVSKIGNEIINGYSCVHMRLTSKGYDKIDMNIWACKDVPGYSIIKKMMNSSNSMLTPDMFNALKQAGADGYFVKIEIKNKDIYLEMVLTKVEEESLPDFLFAIPAGYTASKNNGMISNLINAVQNRK